MKIKLLYLCLFSIIIFALGNSAKAQTINQSDSTIVIKVKGITCPNDCADIANNVKSKQGVKSCEKIGKPSAVTSFEITFNPKTIKYEDIVLAIENTPGCQDSNAKPYKVKEKKK